MSILNRDSALDFDVPAWSAPDSGTSEPGAGGPAIRELDIFSTEPLPEDLPSEGAAPAASQPTTSQPTTRSDNGDGPTESRRTKSGLWLSGDVLLCACPDCRAPMSVRLWLMVADCWNCGTSIELSEEQEREAMELLREREQKPSATSPQKTSSKNTSSKSNKSSVAARRQTPQPAAKQKSAAAAAKTPGKQTPAARGRKTTPVARSQPTAGKKRPQRATAATAQSKVRRRLKQLADEGETKMMIAGLFGEVPAWLVSLMFHLVLLTLLALFTFEDPTPEEEFVVIEQVTETEDKTIDLSHNINERDTEGESDDGPDAKDLVTSDLPIPDQKMLKDDKLRKAIVKADQDARELRLDPTAPSAALPNLDAAKAKITSSNPRDRTFAVRDPRFRAALVKRQGGTLFTEAAVARGLRWLAQHQFPDGRWSLQHFDKAPGAPGKSGGGGNVNDDSAATSLALLPFLGAGQTHLAGRYQDTVSRGLAWLITKQKKNGDLRSSPKSHSGMYAHGQGAIVLCEAYAMTGDEKLREPAQKAIDFIVAAQYRGGGWRYRPAFESPGDRGDTSVLGWQLMALHSARMAGLDVPQKTLAGAAKFLDRVQKGFRYGYTSRRDTRRTMTAEAMLCRIYLGWDQGEPTLRQGMDHLVQSGNLPKAGSPDIYFWYYATQSMHHLGGPQWKEWNEHIRKALLATQEKSGPAAGSWRLKGDKWAERGGRIFATSLAICTLEVYYRHAPVFKRVEVE